MLQIKEQNTNKMQTSFTIPVSLLCVVCGFSSGAYANTTSFTGSTGLITTPSALVAETGKFSWQYNNYIEQRFEDDFKQSANYLFTLGAYPRFEIAGRLTDYESVGERYSESGTLRGKRDLSANLKLNIYRNSESFWISVGGKDIAGLAQNFSSFYGVATGRWKNSLLSFGVAGGDNESFNGVFGNASYQFNEYLKVALEVDTESSINGGLVATLPIGRDLELDATLVGVDGDARAGLTARFKLGKRSYSETLNHRSNDESASSSDTSLTSLGLDSEVNENSSKNLAKYASFLADKGLQRVRISSHSIDHYIVEFESSSFNYSDYDAIAEVVLGAQDFLPASAVVETVLLENGLAKYQDTFNLNGAEKLNKDGLNNSLEYDRARLAWVLPRKTKNRSVADFFLEPALVSAVGTEFGTLDYSLAARVGVSIPLWRGARAIVGSYVPLHNSKNFETGEPYSNRAFELSLERAMLVQYFPLPNRIHAQLELGQVQLRGFDYQALKIQAAWQSNIWPIRLHARIGTYDLNDTDVTSDVMLGSISYTASQWDTVFTATYGQFFYGENAVRLDTTKRFGTTHIGLFAKFIAEDDIAGGMQVSLPIGPRKSWQWNRFSFSGSGRWSHALQTTVKYPNVSDNRLQPALLFEPLVDTEIPQRILDYGRLNSFDFSRQTSF